MQIATFNVRTLNRIGQQPELTASAVERNIVCVQGHRYHHSEVKIKYYYIGKWPCGRVFASDPGDRGSIPGRIIPKTCKMLLDTSLFNTQQYKVCIKSKVDQSRERSSAFAYSSL